jgi:transposase
MSSRSSSAASHPILSKLDELARLSGLIRRRSRKFSAVGFLFALIQCATRGTSSFQHLATSQAGFEQDSMTRQAMSERISPNSSLFLVHVMSGLLSNHADPDASTPFSRILIEDSTVISMAKSNSEHFPNNGNGKAETAGCKINLVTDTVSGLPVSAALHDAKSPDQSISFDLPSECRPGDLIIRDKGYFSIDALEEIERHDAFWISRLPASLTCVDAEGTPLEDLLQKAKSRRLDIEIWVGSHRAHRCRLIATRLSSKATEKNRRQRHRDSKRHRTTASKRSLIHDAWSLIITNVRDGRIDPDQLYKLYSIRWSIEIQFRAMKQSAQLHHSLNHRTDPLLIEALVMAVLIRQLLTIHLHAGLNRSFPKGLRASIEKLSDVYSQFCLTRTRTNLFEPFTYDLRHIVHEKRKRLTLYDITVQSLA